MTDLSSVVEIDGIPVSRISPQTVIDYYRDGGVKYPDNTVKYGIENIPWYEYDQQVAFALLYASAARVSELLRVRPLDFREDKKFIYVRLITKKNPRHPAREVPISKKYDQPYADIIMDYVEKIRGSLGDKAYLFHSDYYGRRPKTRFWLAKMVKRKWYPILSPYLRKPYLARPHLFRHTRLTHLVKFFRLDPYALQRVAGWTSVTPAEYYVHMFTEDIAERMSKIRK